MPEPPWNARLISFLRSVIPAEPAQLLMLGGSVCVVVAAGLSWMPSERALDSLHPEFYDYLRMRSDLVALLILSALLSLFSGFGGYFVCFRPGAHPFRRVVSLVLIPAVTAVLVDFGRLFYVKRLFTSLLDHSISGNLPDLRQAELWTAAPGFHFALAGITLVGIFAVRMRMGLSTLPLHLLSAPASEPGDAGMWSRTQLLIWTLIGPLFFAVMIPVVSIMMIPYVSSRLSNFLQLPWFSRIDTILGSLIEFAVACWIMRPSLWKSVRALSRRFDPRYFGLAVAIPVSVAILISTGNYLLDRSIWAQHGYGVLAPPIFGSYFEFPDPWLLLLFISALLEEIIFRGFLRAIFVQRYGLYRGIFITGIVWAAYHFHSDASPRYTEAGMALQLGFRILMAIAINSVLCWMVLRSGSLLPPAIAHTLYNVLVIGGFGPAFAWKFKLVIAIWGIVGIILFRYWPVQMTAAQPESPTIASPELAG